MFINDCRVLAPILKLIAITVQKSCMIKNICWENAQSGPLSHMVHCLFILTCITLCTLTNDGSMVAIDYQLTQTLTSVTITELKGFKDIDFSLCVFCRKHGLQQ